MESPRYVALLERLIEAARQPQCRKAADAPAAEVVPGLVAGPWRKLRKAVDALPPNPPDADLHQIRILAKRTRYAAEAAAPLVGKKAKAFAVAVAELQEVLGDHQDAVVAEAWLRDAVEGADADGVPGRRRAHRRADGRGRRGPQALAQGVEEGLGGEAPFMDVTASGRGGRRRGGVAALAGRRAGGPPRPPPPLRRLDGAQGQARRRRGPCRRRPAGGRGGDRACAARSARSCRRRPTSTARAGPSGSATGP